MQNKNHIFLQLKKITEVTTLSFLLFYILLPGISTNLYLGIYAAAILILYFAAGDYRNTEILQEFLTAGAFATIGFLISKLAMAAPWQIYGTTNPCFGSCFWKPALLNTLSSGFFR